MTLDPRLAQIRGALAHRPEDDAPLPNGASAVLAPIVPVPQGLLVLLERRPPGNGRFSGHLSFPGGRIEPDDASHLDAALREAEEEVGFAPHDVEVLGHLTDSPDPLGRRVACFVGHVPLEAVPAIAASPDEVAEIILVPLADLLAPRRPPAPDDGWPATTYRAVDYHARTLPSEERFVQYWDLERADGPGKATLWGFTAGLLGLLLHRVYGWEPPVAPRIVSGWDEFMP